MTIETVEPAAPLSADHRPASQVLRDIAVANPAEIETVSIGEIVGAFGERGFGLAIFLFALPSIVPGPPGMSSIVGLPFLLIAVQMMFGKATPWLPDAILRREYKRSDLLRLVERAQPVLLRVERVCRPRLPATFRVLPPRVLGTFISLLALCVMIPLPLTNSLPSVAAVVLAIAIIGADGLLLVAGIAAGFGAIAITFIITGAAIGAVVLGLRALFGA